MLEAASSSQRRVGMVFVFVSTAARCVLVERVQSHLEDVGASRVVVPEWTSFTVVLNKLLMCLRWQLGSTLSVLQAGASDIGALS